MQSNVIQQRVPVYSDPGHWLHVSDSPRHVRVFFGGEAVADSKRVKLVREAEIPRDANHKRLWNGRPYIEDDRRAYESWRAGAFQDLINRLSKYRC